VAPGLQQAAGVDQRHHGLDRQDHGRGREDIGGPQPRVRVGETQQRCGRPTRPIAIIENGETKTSRAQHDLTGEGLDQRRRTTAGGWMAEPSMCDLQRPAPPGRRGPAQGRRVTGQQADTRGVTQEGATRRVWDITRPVKGSEKNRGRASGFQATRPAEALGQPRRARGQRKEKPQVEEGGTARRATGSAGLMTAGVRFKCFGGTGPAGASFLGAGEPARTWGQGWAVLGPEAVGLARFEMELDLGAMENRRRAAGVAFRRR